MKQNTFIPSEFSSARSGDALLSVDKLAFDRGGERLFSDVGFDVDAGQVLQIHGPNGSGKTTLLRVLAGLLQPSAGTVRWRGKDAQARPEVWRQSLAYLGHLNGISDDLTAAENLTFSSVLGEVAEERIEVQEKALESVGSIATGTRLCAACPQDKNAGSLSPGCCWNTSRCGCSTNRRQRWTQNHPVCSNAASRGIWSEAALC
jgi:ABC-type multidrug transport system ATPase subunit